MIFYKITRLRVKEEPTTVEDCSYFESKTRACNYGKKWIEGNKLRGFQIDECLMIEGE
jgi:hypothetical protein